ncbi:ComEC/Rec2 family competence protein [Edaphobacter bradus]|uniref:ComEC/Rec2 family competence protein n=1 Tax=Edaphobacter bradus TaxID=2259016 RepID=UPI0021E000C3|nr:MBL fold metallo-hydrolase [Edaphobacter bradus]
MKRTGWVRRRLWVYAVSVAAVLALQAMNIAGGQSTKGGGGRLKVYFVDVEGGQATLFVTPAGRSLLIDTGWPGNDFRDASRIVATARRAGLRKIDYVLITHYHVDHVGGLPQLLERIPVGAVIDHGPNREMDQGPTEHGYEAYLKAIGDRKIRRITAHSGDVLPIIGMKATVVSSDGDLVTSPLAGGGGANPYCKDSETRPTDETENARSVGVQIVFGKLKLLDLGDLTWDKEMELMCPANRLGTVDVLIVSHHGSDLSSSPALVGALDARVAMMDNGAKKGGSTPTLDTIRKAPALEALWQLHYSEEGGTEHNTPEEFIANPEGVDGEYLELIGSGDGSFDVMNSRTRKSVHYSAR